MLVLKLPAELTIAHVESCKSAMMQYIEEHDTLSFDDSEVKRVDTIGIQFLLAVVIYIASQNKELTWQCKSPMIKESIAQLGIEDAILVQYISA